LTTDKGARRITVSRIGQDHTFSCTGVGVPKDIENLIIEPFVNHLRYFDKNLESEEVDEDA